ncbi:hypothetical protein BST81_20995 [Leptolyngbya sp. 'hensonii']|uniref:2TM domain-containing protein n=1 Tax=Leptolyngbya sp. 'hensonii' TaxID=1922337 RepID=UPI00094FFC92|nr:2TM domain-containing protein [Leptolyngbya sp. 'hensonii']OLP16459.1 hypothetical protein BST81_20995 [Leptolyngbya sp. 'hensonii']
MPPRWPRQPDRKDPAYRRLDDRMNFAVHVALFAVTNSGLWFFQLLNHAGNTAAIWPITPWITGGWLFILFLHAVYIFKVADYSYAAVEMGAPPDSPPTRGKSIND